MTLACEDTNSKLVDIVTVANVDDEDCIGNSLLQIWKVKFGHKVKFLFRLTDSCLVNLIDVTLACEDGNSKLIEVVTVAYFSDEDRVGNSLLQILKLRSGYKVKLLFRL